MNREETLLKLLEAWQDGGPCETGDDALLRELDGDAELRRRFAEQVAMIGSIRATAEENPRWLALFDLLEHGEPGTGMEILSFEETTMERIAPRPRRSRHWPSFIVAVAAVLILLLMGAFMMKRAGSDGTDKSVTTASVPPVSSVAVVIGSSPGTGLEVGTFLKPGLISQDSGWLTLQTLNGVSVTLDAPFRADLLDFNRILLNEGRARVRVPEGAEGFRLDSPTFDVVDLGTEFAARVNHDGTGTCRVFEGMADVSLLDSIGEAKHTKRLLANESVQVNLSDRFLQVIEESNGDYPEIKQPPRPTLALPVSYGADVMEMEPSGYWRFEEIINHEVSDEVGDAPPLLAGGTARIVKEHGGNHSGALTSQDHAGYFQVPDQLTGTLKGNFSISLFAQFEWLQNVALFSAMRYDSVRQGNSFILQAYAAYRRSGLNGTGLHAVLRDPPAWAGGMEVFGNTLMRPLHWHHIAATREGEVFTLYLDGVQVGREITDSAPLDCRQIFIGRLNGNTAQSGREARELVGHIDELAIFPRALTAEEVRKLAVIAE